MDYILEDVFKDVRENDYDTFVKLEQIFQLNVFYPVHIEDDNDWSVAYLMNEYSVITYAFKEGHIKECLNGNRLTGDYHTVSSEENLYDYMRIEDINSLNEAAGLERIKILSPDGPANYIRPYLNKLTEEEFAEFVKYHLATCERQDLIGAAAHTLDILRVK